MAEMQSLAPTSDLALSFIQIFCTLPVAVARSSTDGNAICFVLPVLSMMSRVHIMPGIGPNHRQCTAIKPGFSFCGVYFAL